MRSRLVGCSLAALAAGVGSAAWADCLPLTPVYGGTTTCSGTTNAGLTIGVVQTTNIAAGAVLNAGAGDAAAFTATTDASVYYGVTQTLNVAGAVEGGSAVGVLVLSDPQPYYSLDATTLSIVVAATGVIEGETAIKLATRTGTTTGLSYASVDNDGVIRSTAGPAIVATDAQRTGLYFINNRANGFIGGISSSANALYNAGTIDGGAASAFAALSGPPGISLQTLTNSGAMLSNGTAATVSATSAFLTLVNSGRIANLGSGLTLDIGGTTQSFTNATGAVIASAGPIAVRLANVTTFVNRGVITGSVVSTGSGYGVSTWDLAGGTINGDLLLGAVSDTLIARLDVATGRILGVSGQIDGGGGQNLLLVEFASDTVLDGVLDRVVLPTNFQTFQVQLRQSAAVTLNGDAPDGLTFRGIGSLKTTGVMTSNGQALQLFDNGETSISYANSGAITSTFGAPVSVDPLYTEISQYAVAAGGASAFSNSGSITSINGHGVLVSNDLGVAGFSNSGSITAYGVALSAGGGFVNSGAIKSTDAFGASVYNYNNGVFTNTGSIEGKTAGVLLSSGTLVNSGTITATDGVGVSLTYDGAIENSAGGVITGAIAIKPRFSFGGGKITNAGTINGDIDFRSDPSSFIFGVVTYVDVGGKLNGNLLLGGGDDTFVADLSTMRDGKFTSISGVVDAGAGRDRLVLGVGQDATASLDPAATFEVVAIEMRDGAKATLTSSKTLTNTLEIIGQGTVDLTADITTNWDEAIYTYGDWAPYGGTDFDLSIISRGAITYTQILPSSPTTSSVIALRPGVDFENAGSISAASYASPYATAVTVIQGGDLIVNSGTITLDGVTGVANSAEFVNSGVLQQGQGARSSVGVSNVLEITNSGTISTGGYAIAIAGYNASNTPTTITNSGLIQSTASDAIHQTYGSAVIIDNQAGGRIVSTTGKAITTFWNADTVRNDGVIIGDISLAGGDDLIENYGSITGDVDLGDGNDSFVQWVGGSMTGVVDGGYGLDTLVIDSTGGGSVSGANFVNFESFRQIGGGKLVYDGAFSGAISLNGGGAEILAGTVVSTPAFLGGAGSEQVVNAGLIQGSISLGDGADSVENRGFIDGSVRLGAGDDVYLAGLGSGVQSLIDGGAGTDTYVAELDGAWGNLLYGVNFERLGLIGTGSLNLALQQDWQTISLAGVGLTLQQGAYTVGAVSGGDAAETVLIDRDIAKVDLGGGSDALTLGGSTFAGVYIGGSGVDSLTYTTTDKVVVSGSVSGFETIALTGAGIDVSGALGVDGDSLTFLGGSQTLSVLSGGALSGTVNLGAGDDVFRLAAGGQLLGTVLGGAGSDTAAIELTADLSLRGDQLQQFETLQVTGSGALNFTGGAAQFDRLVSSSKDLVVAAGSSLGAGALTFDGAANLMTVAGAFSGAVDLGAGDDTLRLTTGGVFTGSAVGGTGSDRLELALGGTDAAPIALGGAVFTGFETLSLQSGVVSFSGDYGFDTIQISNGRLIGLAGSQLRGAVTVAQGATFGSAGTVTGDIAVSGTLSPGASPGTMTVNGNVSLATGSTALFELSSTLSDKLLVSGKLTIAQGAALKLVGGASLTPGRTLDLIVASGGISGAFSTVDGASDLHLRQSATRLQAVGLFSTDAAYSAQVSSTIATLNAAFVADTASADLIAAMPALIDSTTGKSAPQALARLAPQPYASALQLATEDALSIVDASRNQSRFAPDSPGLFGFGQAIGGRRTLDGDAAAGVASGKITSSGALAGVGYGVKSAWLGGFVGYLSGRQSIGDLDARTSTDSFVVGAQGQARFGGFQLDLMAARDAADADTQRAAPGGATPTGSYELESWVGDLALSYSAKLNADWRVRPRLGASYVRTTRDGFAEKGGGAFALTLESDKASAWFVDAQLEVLGGQAAGQRLHPHASVGVRTRGGDDTVSASATLAGLETPLTATGLERAKTLATGGAGFRYDVSPSLAVSADYLGEFGDGGRQAALVGLRLVF